MAMTRYQRKMVEYVKANHPCYPKRKTKGMSKRELAELERQADDNAMAWLDRHVRQWRDGNPPKTNKIYVTMGPDEEENDE
ncbi:hypothetical protein J2S82_003409 [Aeromonas caviae]|uniref:hypothetical protein n=1 Tax=Aeromonas caviae TaxID=648 RepID=UPI00209D87D0|nr:hypothetical protein [Aeromonas caviae]MCP1601452.1 hypothetical protein [Aeromonas caviae]